MNTTNSSSLKEETSMPKQVFAELIKKEKLLDDLY